MKNMAAIAACSNPLKETCRGEIGELTDFLEANGRPVLQSPCIFENQCVAPVSGKQRARALMNLFENRDITEIFDVSGGDMANEILEDLDYEKIGSSRAVFWGYSDLTTVLNAIYFMTGKSGVLYQIRSLTGPAGELQRRRFLHREELFSPSFRMIRGKSMEGIVVGGNMRCFLKLAGTRYWGDLTGKILLLEARSGSVPQMITCLSQLRSCGAFEKVSGILLGTFSQMEAEHCAPDILTLVRAFAGEDIPIAKTEEIGHGPDSKAIWIGEKIQIEK